MRSLLLRVCGLSLAAALCLSAADPMLGAWKLNLAKSKYDPGPAPKSMTSAYSADGDWVVIKTEGVDSAGKPFSSNNKYKRDGKEYPWKTNTVEGMITVKLVDSHRAASTTKRDGKVVSSTETTISKNGKIRTATSEGTNADGKKFKNVTVSDRQ